MIEFVEDELTIKVTEKIRWDHTVRWVYDRVMEALMYTAEYEDDEELVQKYKELESDKLSHKNKAEIMGLICEEMAWRNGYYDEDRVFVTLCDWIKEKTED